MLGMPWHRIVLTRFTIDTKVSGVSNNAEEKHRCIHDPKNSQKLAKNIV